MQILAFTELQAAQARLNRELHENGLGGDANWSEMLPGPQQTIADLFLKQCSPDCAVSEQDFHQSSEHNGQNCHIWARMPQVPRKDNVDLGSVLGCSTWWAVKFILFTSKI